MTIYFGKKALEIVKEHNIPPHLYRKFKETAEKLKQMRGKKRICLKELKDAAKKTMINYPRYPRNSVDNKKVTRSGRVYSRPCVCLNTVPSLDAVFNLCAQQSALYYKNPKNPDLSREDYLELHGQCFDHYNDMSYQELKRR